MNRSTASPRTRALVGALGLAAALLLAAVWGAWPGAGADEALGTRAPLGPPGDGASTLLPGRGEGAAVPRELATAPAPARRDAAAPADGSRRLDGADGEALTGRVLDHDTGAPLEGALVRARGEGWESEGASDAEGRFELRVLPGTTPLLEARHAGHAPLRRVLHGPEDGTIAVHEVGAFLEGEAAGEELLLLLRRGSALVGRLTGVAPELLEGGRVHLWDLALDPGASGEGTPAEPDGAGAFAFEDLAGGEYTLLASVPGHRPAYLARVTVPEAERVEVELELLPGASLAGHVRAPDGEPRGGVSVSADWNQEGVGRGLRALGRRETLTAEDGSYELAGLGAGSLLVIAEDGLGAREGERLEVREDGEELELDLVLPLPGSLAGVVRTTSGLGVAHASVQVLWDRDRDAEDLDLLLRGGTEGELRTVADLNGRFLLEGVPAGRGLLLRALREPAGGGGAGAVELLGEGLRLGLESGEAREDLELQLAEPRELVVLLRDRYGRPAAGVELELGYFPPGGRGRRRSVPHQRGRTDEEGRCRFEALLQRRHALVFGEPVLPRRAHTFDVPPLPAPLEDLVLTVDLGDFVEGIVVDQDGDAVPSARVRSRLSAPVDPEVREPDDLDARADDFGRFRLGPLPAGVHELTASAAGCAPSLVPEVVRTGEGGVVVLELEREGPPGTATVHGRLFVTDGRELENFHIAPRRGGALELDGERFRLTGVRTGEVAFTVAADGYLDHGTGPLRLAPGAEVDLGLVELRPAGTLRVYARDEKKKPVNDFTVALEPLDGQRHLPRFSERKMRHLFRGDRRPMNAVQRSSNQVELGHWRLLVRAKGFEPWSQEIVVKEGGSTRFVEAELKPIPKRRRKGRGGAGQPGGEEH